MNNKLVLSKLVLIPLTLLAVIGIVNLQPAQVKAQAKNYELAKLRVQIKVNDDSSMQVSEEISYVFDDEMNGMFREITLSDNENLERCRANANLQCGGFSFINIDKVFVNGEEVEEGRYEIMEVVRGSEERLRVQYEFAGAPVRLYNEKYTFRVDYTVLGGIGFFEDYDLFYWNTIFPDRDQTIKLSEVEITYPGPVSLKPGDSQVLSSGGPKYEVNQTANTVRYRTENIPPYQEFTVIQKIAKGLVAEPASLELSLKPANQTLNYGRFELEVEDGQVLTGMLAGPNKFSFSQRFYQSKQVELDLKPGTKEQLTIELEMTTFGRIYYAAIVLVNVLCCCLALLTPLGLYLWWQRNGRDLGLKATVIPEFNPPAGMKSYLLGSLKDETVDNTDITAAIIDLAYRGHIKIIEGKKGLLGLGSRDFTLVKLDSKDELDPIETKIMEMLFSGSKTTVKLSELKYKAYTKISGIRNAIYDELVAQGYFASNPNSKRNNWLGIGIALLIFGIAASVGLFFLLIITAILLALSAGIGLIILSRYLPAKTKAGGEALMAVRGFKMYLETAEKYTLQNLTPDMFEKYLSYAMVFGVEKQWAESFKDIYKGMPDWYQAADSSTFNSLVLADALRGFNTSSASTVTARPSNSSSGSGWSGGGGFSGGFSGGGGGGGGGGAW